MPILLFIFAALLTIVVPIIAAATVFFMKLPRWIDRIVLSDPRTHERLQLDVSEESIGWTVTSDGSAARRLPYGPLAYAAFTGLVVTAIETIAFALNSAVPRLWLVAGLIVAATMIVLTIALVWILKRPISPASTRQLAQRRHVRVCGPAAVRNLVDFAADRQDLRADRSAGAIRCAGAEPAGVADIRQARARRGIGRGDRVKIQGGA